MLNARKSAEARNQAMLPLFAADEKEMVEGVIEGLARYQEEITSDDVWRELEHRGITKLDRHNVMGAAFRASKFITPTGRIRKSARVSRQSGMVQIWRSLKFQGVA